MNARAKWAYLTYDMMIERIQDGTLDQYDVCYVYDRKENYIISPELEPWAVRSRIYTFDSVNEANRILNINTDTYVGQIVSILKGDKYTGYVVNKNVNNIFEATPLTLDEIDYNTLGNRPIENLVGTFENPIMVSTLLSGTYKIKGQYKITNEDETVYLSADGDLFLIEISEDVKYIKRFTKDSIFDFTIDTDGITKKKYITDEYLRECGYASTEYVDAKMIAFEETIKADIEAYVESTVEQVITEKVDTIINERFEEKFNDNIEGITEEEVRSLF